MSARAALHARWSLDEGAHEHVVFVAEGIRCAGCARSIERAVRTLPEVDAVHVNSVTARVSVDWRGGGGTDLGGILAAVEGAGFKPVPLAGEAAESEYQREHRASLKRFGLAALGMMQAMMYLGALYGASDIDASMTRLMGLAGMIIVTPVLFYSGMPFLKGAWRDITGRRLGMDVPVAAALLIAWAPSVVNTFRGTGEIYFDSVAMFIFFLTAGRFIEMSVRHRSLSTGEALGRSLPASVSRLMAGGATEKIDVRELAPGDRFLVPKGAVVAVDARIDAAGDVRERVALLDEALLTGESAAVTRREGELIRGGSVNLGAPLEFVAVKALGQSTLASIVALLERAQVARPGIARTADRVASWFAFSILVLAVVVAGLWMVVDPSRAFVAVLAVLVVTCPCALSLATPAALAAATLRLARLGVLVTRADAVERLARVDTVVFDKTGTLTATHTEIAQVRVFGAEHRERLLAIAAALERASDHPIAAAFTAHAEGATVAHSVREEAGLGLEGEVAGHVWRLGTRGFVAALARSQNVAPLVPADVDDSAVFLGDAAGLAAAFEIRAPLRGDAREAVAELRRQGLRIVIASGDSHAAVAYVAKALGVPHSQARGRLTPNDKLALVAELQASGRRVFMVGDGINDGPVLASADVSCAPGEGSAVAQSAADLLLLHEGLRALPRAVATSRTTLRVIRQNLGWSFAYNLAAVPLAALGFVSPWAAALGMSLSSLGVVLNARRIALGGHAS
jgi:Cu2+-exporting ATPase